MNIYDNPPACGIVLVVLIITRLVDDSPSAGEVKMPSGKLDKPVIQDNRDGTVSIRYEPREEGLHELHVKYNSEHVQGEQWPTPTQSVISVSRFVFQKNPRPLLYSANAKASGTHTQTANFSLPKHPNCAAST